MKGKGVMVFALGWGCDRKVVEHLAPLWEGYDTMWLCDWPNIDAQAARAEAEKYGRRRLAAWSFGVWGAERIFAGMEFERAVAFGGTPLPCDARLGIGEKKLRLTIRGLQAQGAGEFYRRAYGDRYAELLPMLGPRGLKADIAELEWLCLHSAQPYTPSIAWDAAVIGSLDQIFPPSGMMAYWGDKAVTLPLPHYPFGNAETIAPFIK